MKFPMLVVLISASYITLSDHMKHGQEGFYIGAVVEYSPIGTPWNSTPDELLTKNTAEYVRMISEASQNSADIVVFPEYGLTTLGMPRDRENARPYLQLVPEIGSNPCLADGDDPRFSSMVIRNLSCAARNDRIYVVVNLGEIEPCSVLNKDECVKSMMENHIADECPPDHAFQYNTNVVFDREGSVIAKYHKYQLYFEDQFNIPSNPDIVTFDTSFGVTFGVFTCFDIIFYQPAVHHVANGVRNFVFPSAWVDELPFLMAPQSHSIWAMGANVNLLASGYHQPLGGQLGSGIYSGASGPLNYTFNPESETKLILAKIPIVPNEAKNMESTGNHPIQKSSKFQYHSFLHENLTNYSTVILDLQGQNEQTVCDDQFCCTINYSVAIRNDAKSADSSRNYRLVAFDGIRPVAQETDEFGWQICGVLRCLNETLTSCTQREAEEAELETFKYFQLVSSSFSLDGVMKPSLNTLDVNFSVIPFQWFDFSTGEGEDSEGGRANIVQVSSSSLTNVPLQTIAIVNRIYLNTK